MPTISQALFAERFSRASSSKKHCRMTWYGPGAGGICVACERPIGVIDVEVECDLPDGGTIRLHRTCYDLWSKEWPTCL